MNDQLTEILFILDRSGSMDSMHQEAIDGFNAFLKDQAELPGQARLTLVLFDHEYEVAVDAVPVQEVIALDGNTYQPRGSTALLDAIAKGVDSLGQRLAQTEEAERPGQVIVAILTDGEENSSTQTNWQAVQDRITHQTHTYSWKFFFLGANQDAIATASRIGIHAHNSANFVGDKVGASSASAAFRRKTRSLRKSALMASLSFAEGKDLAAPLDEMVSEEDSKSRRT